MQLKITNYCVWLITRNPKPQSVRRKLYALQSFVHFFCDSSVLWKVLGLNSVIPVNGFVCVCIERNKNKEKKKVIIYFRRCPDHWKGLLALRTNRGCVNLEKSASRSFIKLLCFKKENAFFIFMPKQISQRLTFYAEMTLRALFHFTLTLQDANENLSRFTHLALSSTAQCKH